MLVTSRPVGRWICCLTERRPARPHGSRSDPASRSSAGTAHRFSRKAPQPGNPRRRRSPIAGIRGTTSGRPLSGLSPATASARVLVPDPERKAVEPAPPEERADSQWRSDRFAIASEPGTPRSMRGWKSATVAFHRAAAPADSPHCQEPRLRCEAERPFSRPVAAPQDLRPRRVQALSGPTLGRGLHQRLESLGGDRSLGPSRQLRPGQRRPARGAHFPRSVTAQPLAPRVVTRWILSRPETLTQTEQLRFKAVLANCPELDASTVTSELSLRCSPSARANGCRSA